jgi:hypothetical protein
MSLPRIVAYNDGIVQDHKINDVSYYEIVYGHSNDTNC